jgi:hypothetical protein
VPVINFGVLAVVVVVAVLEDFVGAVLVDLPNFTL